jgi:DMSO/TMAO reductase YedYZ molybdopterin-dependent catalytic subunit
MPNFAHHLPFARAGERKHACFDVNRADRPVLDPAGFHRRIPLQPHQMIERLTPTQDVIVLCHLGVPRVARAAWSLSIEGLVERPATLRFNDLARYPRHAVTTVHQCAGSPLAPREPTRRVANVTWGGARLKDVLADCGVRSEARYVWSSGLDYGKFDQAEVEAYTKDLPIERVGADVLLAYALNGEPLPVENGFPVRLVVPGFYGTNSVKWLSRIALARDRAPGPFTTRYYNDPILDASERDTGRTQPVWSIAPESVIVAPAPGATIARGAEIEIWGWAWSDAGIAAVEVFAGDEPAQATIEQRSGRAWQCFHTTWRPQRAGAVTLRSIARTADGTVQPGDGFRNAVYRVAVTVA